MLTMALALLLGACGGGGGGGGAGPSGGGIGGTGGGTGGTGGTGGGTGTGGSSGWVAGVFMPAASFEAQCENPRTGIDPTTGVPYADVQGETLDENNWLRSWSNDTYLWYDEIADVDPGLYGNPSAYFSLLKTFETTPSGRPKDQFHFTYPTDEFIALAQSGVAVGYGAVWAVSDTVPREIVVAHVEPGWPAADGGLARGARVLSIDGVDAVNDDTPAGLIAIMTALFPAEDGESHSFEVLDLGSENARFVQLTAEPVTSTPVPTVGTVTSPAGATVGYLLFNDHIATAEQGLIDAVEGLLDVPEGIDDLVLDIRYNGGGFLAIASQLAYMIAGDGPTAGVTFELMQFNDKHPSTNPVTLDPIVPMPFIDVTLGFSAPATVPPTPLPALDLPRVFVLTGGGTCSASEAIINGLRGAGVQVIQIGTTTCGKPHGFYPTDNCGTTYFTIQFRGVNHLGFGDYEDGFTPAGSTAGGDAAPPGCVVADDFSEALGDPSEARLAAALHFRDTLACPVPAPVMFSKTTLRAGEALPRTAEPVVFKPPVLTNRLAAR